MEEQDVKTTKDPLNEGLALLAKLIARDIWNKKIQKRGSNEKQKSDFLSW